MVGFIESFNISVSAALTMNTVRNRLNESQINWKLSPEEQTLLKREWCKKIIKKPDNVVNNLKRRISDSL